MRHPEVSEFEFAEFQKTKIVSLTKEIMAFINNDGITVALWSIQPWQIVLKVQTSRSDAMFTEMMFNVYQKWDQVGAVGIAIDHVARAQLLQIHLNEKWFKEAEGNGSVGTQEKKHPEDREGFSV
jgi:hypothetical protein